MAYRKHSSIMDLSVDIKRIILEHLDNRSMAYLSQTCTYFAKLVQSILSFRHAHVGVVDHLLPKLPPFLNYRTGALIGWTFYMPFIDESPFCYTCDMNSNVWTTEKLHLTEEIQPQITCAAVIGSKIYLVCGRLLNSYTLSNGLIEIDTSNFKVKLLKDTLGVPPRPRHEHSVDTVGNRYLVVFGGLCYNSVGENDVFVYDTFENRWFVPPIIGHLPHLRFGHASTVIGNDLYIHGGAQLDNNGSYIVYEDLYKLDCETWVWYKYEHPEVERYLRHQAPVVAEGSTPQRNHLISTYGDSPYDRFQAYMCSYGNKLVIFGGHSIREDDDDNEILCSYPMDELSVFSTRRQQWTVLRAATKRHQGTLEGEGEEDPITVSDMSAASIQLPTGRLRIYIIAGRKDAEVSISRARGSDKGSFSSRQSSSPNSNESLRSAEYFTTSTNVLPRIKENNQDNHDSDGDSVMVDSNVVKSESESENEPSRQRDVIRPNSSDRSEIVKTLFRAIEPDMEGQQDRESDQDAPILENNNLVNGSNGSASGSNGSGSRVVSSNHNTKRRRRPSISLIHRSSSSSSSSTPLDDLPEILQHGKTTSSSSSYSSGSGGLGKRFSRQKQKTVTPCTIVLDLME